MTHTETAETGEHPDPHPVRPRPSREVAVARDPGDPATGPIATALAGLRTWLTGATGMPVDAAIPDGREPARLCVWPLGLLADQGTRGGPGPAPLRLRTRCLVAAGGPLDVAVDLIDRVLLAAAGEDRYRLVPEPVPADLWGHPPVPRPAVLIDVPVRIAVPAPQAHRVTAELHLDGGPVRTITGRLVGPGDVALPGMTVASPATGTSVLTDPRGGFALPGQPGGRSVLLHLSGRGLRLQVEVAPEATPPVVVHCPIEEV